MSVTETLSNTKTPSKRKYIHIENPYDSGTQATLDSKCDSEQSLQKKLKKGNSVWVLTHISELCDIHCDENGWSTLVSVDVFPTEDMAEEAKYNMLKDYVSEQYDDYINRGREDDYPHHNEYDDNSEDAFEDNTPAKEFSELTKKEVIDLFDEINENASEYNPNPDKFEVRECQFGVAR